MNKKFIHDLAASLAAIASSVADYHSGDVQACRSVAVELGKLLCAQKAKTDNALIKRLFPDFRLRPLAVKPDNIGGPGCVKLSGLFNEPAAALLLDEWLEQKLWDEATTIRSFILSVADEEGAPSSNSGRTVLALASYVVKALAIRKVNDNIVDIGAFVLQEYARVGRGVALLDLDLLAARFAEGIPLQYEPVPIVKDYFKRDPAACESTMRILQEYRPSDSFLLLVVDLNGELWLYQQEIKTAT